MPNKCINQIHIKYYFQQKITDGMVKYINDYISFKN